MNLPKRAEINERQDAAQEAGASEVDTAKAPSEVSEAGKSLLAVCGLILAGIAMLGWICALAWISWRLVAWLLF